MFCLHCILKSTPDSTLVILLHYNNLHNREDEPPVGGRAANTSKYYKYKTTDRGDEPPVGGRAASLYVLKGISDCEI
ncbi:hypothetical protein L873DRAFT_869998 [Choiromyces venosus 120613-1]|uniref:Uncharacterized protein n=1 Tax=Choiromyces venosus 120613-1 TaxID=1336337 RepID=A0A3N4IVC0_9PEZI|nr:hypothetical protein L873DRAFT_869998 [Choiromyces venosus 120613-1]